MPGRALHITCYHGFCPCCGCYPYIPGLVANVVVLWNTLYIDAALSHLRSTGYDVKPEDVARLSPLITRHIHIHFLGRYTFSLSEAAAQGRLRPLRDPDSPDEG